MFNLKDFRENSLKMTQTDFATMLGVRQDVVSRWEKDPEKISLEDFQKICFKCGVSFEQLVSYKKPQLEGLKTVNNNWYKADATKQIIIEYIDNFLKKGELHEVQTLFSLKKFMQSAVRKPKVAVIGRSDVGKSAIINSLLGQDKMPTAWTPTTSIAVYIKHIKDRPAYIRDDACIFKAGNKDEMVWDESKLDDEEYCANWRIDSGSTDILKTYGTRQGADSIKDEAGSAVIFVDSQILESCDIIDLPGFGTGDRVEDDTITLNVKNTADVLIYMSIANGFMRSEDIAYLKECIPRLTTLENNITDKTKNDLLPLSNLFIVASQAHTVNRGNPKDLELILNKGCDRLLKTIPEGFWDTKEQISGYKYTKEVIRKRFFTYTTDNANLRSDFENDLSKLLSDIPTIIENNAKKEVKEISIKQSSYLEKEIQKIMNLLNERDKWIDILKKLRAQEPERIIKNNKNKEIFLANLEKEAKETEINFQDAYNKILNVDHIVHIIEKKDFKKKKEDLNDLSSYLNTECQLSLEKTIKNSNLKMKEYIDQYLQHYQSNIEKIDTNLSVTADFDVSSAFAAGLAGITTFGALAFWASTFGNLGAYILVAKGVSILSALGISLGGTAATISAVSAIGGPVTLGVGLAIILALSLYNMCSDWKKGVAKKIIKEYTSHEVYEQYIKVVRTYWEDTKNAFKIATDNLDKEWKTHIENLSADIISCDVNELQEKINKCEETKVFFENIPL